jgi:signal transduction histidine kinase
MQVALYRIAQEALNNVAKHARAKEAWVNLRCGAKAGMLEVIDDGRGFDVVASADAPEHLGLGIMRERAEAIGADFTVESLPGQGARVCVRWPNEGGGHS